MGENRAQVDLFRRAVIDREFIEGDHEIEDLSKTSFNEDDRREAENKEVEKKSDNFIQEPGIQLDVPEYLKDNEVDERHEAQAERKADSESYDSEDLTKMSVEEDDRREAELKIEKKIDSGVGQEPDLELNVPAYLRQGVKEEAEEEIEGEKEGSTSE